MSLIGLLILLLVVGIVLALVPMDPTVRRYVLIAVGVLFAVWLIYFLFGAGGVVERPVVRPAEPVIVR